ncbi:hypothetical protein Ocin01_11205 [Orchesella cincta]|uniref:Uncharacterized protein n=1 Tax=Orchesella cincta TaxID=48709 RepID=A0A1D2MR11_ORCCI|nr:hypothetical protein Ocin01_11205 [Orchesella cincta]
MGKKLRKSRDPYPIYVQVPSPPKKQKWSITGDFLVDVVLLAGIIDMFIGFSLFYFAYLMLDGFDTMEDMLSTTTSLVATVAETTALKNQLEDMKRAELYGAATTCETPTMDTIDIVSGVYYVGLMIRLFVALVAFVSITFISSVLFLFIGIYQKRYMYCEIWIFFNRIFLATCVTLLIAGMYTNLFEMEVYCMVFFSYMFYRLSVEFGIRYFQRKTTEWNDLLGYCRNF